MKKEDGLSMIWAGILICITIAIICVIGYRTNLNINKEKSEDIKANMLLIQGACKVANQNSIVKKSSDALVGTKLTTADDSIINKFKEIKIITESEYEKYYMLTNEDLEKLNLQIKNEKDSYYLINYETSDVLITKGYNGKYKLSEINQ